MLDAANNPNGMRFDAILPPEMAAKAEQIGVKKANMAFYPMFVLSVLAGAFIALGAIFATTVSAGSIVVTATDGSLALTSGMPYGMVRLLAGLVFSLGLILVVIGGAELFTGNILIIMAWASRKVKTVSLLRNWAIVYTGNFVGAVLTALVMYFSAQYTFGNGAIGIHALNAANAKTGLGFFQAVALGIMCNALVCLAVWMCYSARTTTDKILAIIPPISAFVAAGFEHSIANMYYIPIALFIKSWAPSNFWHTINASPGQFSNLTWGNFFINNLLPVTIGNIIGGAVMVGAVYWFIYLRNVTEHSAAEPQPEVKGDPGVTIR
jgi:formate transporter